MYKGSNANFNMECTKSETAVRFSAPHTHEQHGMIERIWRTLFDYVRAALLYAGAPKEWWDIALLYAAYVYNRASHSSLKDKSPIQVWTGVVADCSMFRTLFCPVYTLIPEKQRLDKVSSRVQLGINFGPDQSTKDAWKIYLPHKKICITSRDCKFDEGWRKRALTILTPSAPIGVSEPYQIRYLPHSENLKSILVSKIGQPRPSPLLPKTVPFAPEPTPLGVTVPMFLIILVTNLLMIQ